MARLKLVWNVRTCREFTSVQLIDMLRLRVDVFVVEQQCPYPEIDDADRLERTKHLLGYGPGEMLMAYARIIPPLQDGAKVTMGRFVVKKENRGQGIGHELLRRALEERSTLWPASPIKISAQEHLQQFYSQYGFNPVSDRFLDYGVPHILMQKDP